MNEFSSLLYYLILIISVVVIVGIIVYNYPLELYTRSLEELSVPIPLSWSSLSFVYYSGNEKLVSVDIPSDITIASITSTNVTDSVTIYVDENFEKNGGIDVNIKFEAFRGSLRVDPNYKVKFEFNNDSSSVVFIGYGDMVVSSIDPGERGTFEYIYKTNNLVQIQLSELKKYRL